MPQVRSNELFLQVAPISKLYTDSKGLFPVRACSGHQYVTIVYHRDANLKLAVPFNTRKETHCLKAYNKIIQRLRDHRLHVDLQILDIEAITKYKRVIKEIWKINYQLFPPNTHQRNAAEPSIQTFKDHFISILAGFPSDFPRNIWDLLLPQTEVTLNLLQQATPDPSRSAWTYFHGPFNYDATPLGPLGCHIFYHNNTGTRNLWDFRGAAGWNVGVKLQHYRLHTILVKATKAVQVLDTVEFRHHHLTLPDLTLADRIVHGATTLMCALQNAPVIACDNQLSAIQALHQAIQQWAHPNIPSSKVAPVPPPPPTATWRRSVMPPMRRQAPVQPHA